MNYIWYILEYIIEQIDDIKISAEKKLLQAQLLMNKLFIVELEKPENEVKRTEEFDIFQQSKPE